MQDKIFKVKNFEVTHKSVKSVKVFSLEIFRLYGSNVECIFQGLQISHISWILGTSMKFIPPKIIGNFIVM